MGSADSIDEIFDASLQCLAEGLRVERSSILLLDSTGVMRFRAWAGLSDEYRAAVEGHSPWPADAEAPQPVLVPDVCADAELVSLLPVLDREGVRACAFIPLTLRGRLVGKFMLYYAEPHSF
ncbi:MAG: GAF domain-containing protein, partial [Dehalococcoidia bacterium]|nr:GAF domain-containing protein [Dehalococcoidia bacterium]